MFNSNIIFLMIHHFIYFYIHTFLFACFVLCTHRHHHSVGGESQKPRTLCGVSLPVVSLLTLIRRLQTKAASLIWGGGATGHLNPRSLNQNMKVQLGGCNDSRKQDRVIWAFRSSRWFREWDKKRERGRERESEHPNTCSILNSHS